MFVSADLFQKLGKAPDDPDDCEIRLDIAVLYCVPKSIRVAIQGIDLIPSQVTGETDLTIPSQVLQLPPHQQQSLLNFVQRLQLLIKQDLALRLLRDSSPEPSHLLATINHLCHMAESLPYGVSTSRIPMVFVLNEATSIELLTEVIDSIN